MLVKDIVTVDTTTNATKYTTPVSKRRATQFAVQLMWAGTTLTTAVTVQGSNRQNPGLTSDADWVTLSDITVAGPSSATTGGSGATVGNASFKWYRLKLVTSAGSGTITTFVEIERT